MQKINFKIQNTVVRSCVWTNNNTDLCSCAKTICWKLNTTIRVKQDRNNILGCLQRMGTRQTDLFPNDVQARAEGNQKSNSKFSQWDKEKCSKVHFPFQQKDTLSRLHPCSSRTLNSEILNSHLNFCQLKSDCVMEIKNTVERSVHLRLKLQMTNNQKMQDVKTTHQSCNHPSPLVLWYIYVHLVDTQVWTESTTWCSGNSVISFEGLSIPLHPTLKFLNFLLFNAPRETISK